MLFTVWDSNRPIKARKGPFLGNLNILTSYFGGSLCKPLIIVGIIRMGSEISKFRNSTLYIQCFEEQPSHMYRSHSLEAEYPSSEVTMGIQLSMNKEHLLQIELSIGTDPTYGHMVMRWRGEGFISPPTP